MKLGLFLALMMPSSALAQQQFPDAEEASPRQLYVACSLMLTGDDLAEREVLGRYKPTSAPSCLAATIRALALGNGRNAEKPLRFCPSGSLDFDTDPPKAMARAYVEYFENAAPQIAKISGLAAFVLAQKEKWPCEQ